MSAPPLKRSSSSSSSNVNLSSTGGTIDDLSDELLQEICGVYFEGIVAVLTPSVVCRRWRALLIADDVWEGKFERDGMRAKAALFEVSVPMKKSDVRAVGLLARRVTAVLYCEIFLLKVCRVRRSSAPHRTHRAAAPQGFKMKNQVWELDDVDTGKMEGASLARGALSTTQTPACRCSTFSSCGRWNSNSSPSLPREFGCRESALRANGVMGRLRDRRHGELVLQMGRIQ